MYIYLFMCLFFIYWMHNVYLSVYRASLQYFHSFSHLLVPFLPINKSNILALFIPSTRLNALGGGIIHRSVCFSLFLKGLQFAKHAAKEQK